MCFHWLLNLLYISILAEFFVQKLKSRRGSKNRIFYNSQQMSLPGFDDASTAALLSLQANMISALQHALERQNSVSVQEVEERPEAAQKRLKRPREDELSLHSSSADSPVVESKQKKQQRLQWRTDGFGTACSICHSQKAKCDGKRPCSRCVHNKRSDACVDRKRKNARHNHAPKRGGTARVCVFRCV